MSNDSIQSNEFNASLFGAWEKKIYSHGKQHNIFPHTDLVSYVYNYAYPEIKLSSSTAKVLEIGSGTGNNLNFFSKLGFETYGVDGSKTACDKARQFLDSQASFANIDECDFASLPYEDNFFDLVVDRAAMYANNFSTITRTVSEVERVLKNNGKFISITFSEKHMYANLKYAKKYENNTYYEYTDGPFQDTGLVHFFSVNEIQKLFSNFKIDFLYEQNKINPFSLDIVNAEIHFGARCSKV